MMNIIEKKNIEVACFEVNIHGRLLSGNRRFCRMFGFEESEIQWHYVTDLYRYAKEWNEFRNAFEGCCFDVRLKNRRGRSFDCTIVREVFTNEVGEICFRNMVQRKDESVELKIAENKNTSIVYLAKCAHCGNQIRVSSVGETRLRMLCNGCAARAYPEAFQVKEVKSI